VPASTQLRKLLTLLASAHEHELVQDVEEAEAAARPRATAIASVSPRSNLVLPSIGTRIL
jgi:hypothetical protein